MDLYTVSNVFLKEKTPNAPFVLEKKDRLAPFNQGAF